MLPNNNGAVIMAIDKPHYSILCNKLCQAIAAVWPNNNCAVIMTIDIARVHLLNRILPYMRGWKAELTYVSTAVKTVQPVPKDIGCCVLSSGFQSMSPHHGLAYQATGTIGHARCRGTTFSVRLILITNSAFSDDRVADHCFICDVSSLLSIKLLPFAELIDR